MLDDRFNQAFLLASRLHRGQIRKAGGEPYLSHLLGVCSLVLEYGGTQTEGMAALLHDGAEDQGGRRTLEEIARVCGEQVARIVEDLSDSLEDKDQEKAPWKARKETYLSAVPTHSYSTRLVGFCDKLHNLESLIGALVTQGEKAWELFKGKKQGTLWYLGEINRLMLPMGDFPLALRHRWARSWQALQTLAKDPG